MALYRHADSAPRRGCAGRWRWWRQAERRVVELALLPRRGAGEVSPSLTTMARSWLPACVSAVDLVRCATRTWRRAPHLLEAASPSSCTSTRAPSTRLRRRPRRGGIAPRERGGREEHVPGRHGRHARDPRGLQERRRREPALPAREGPRRGARARALRRRDDRAADHGDEPRGSRRRRRPRSSTCSPDPMALTCSGTSAGHGADAAEGFAQAHGVLQVPREPDGPLHAAQRAADARRAPRARARREAPGADRARLHGQRDGSRRPLPAEPREAPHRCARSSRSPPCRALTRDRSRPAARSASSTPSRRTRAAG